MVSNQSSHWQEYCSRSANGIARVIARWSIRAPVESQQLCTVSMCAGCTNILSCCSGTTQDGWERMGTQVHGDLGRGTEEVLADGLLSLPGLRFATKSCADKGWKPVKFLLDHWNHQCPLHGCQMQTRLLPQATVPTYSSSSKLASESRRGRGMVPKTLIDFGGVIGPIGRSTAC